MRINKTTGWIAFTLALTMSLTWWAFRPAPIAVEVAEVTRGSFVKTIDDDGKTRVRERYVVSAPLAGTLQRVERHVGDRVAVGEVVAVIQPQLPAMLDERMREALISQVGVADAAHLRAIARVQQITVSLTQARSELERSRKLAASQLISRAKVEEDTLLVDARSKELEAARADVHVAQHEVEAAKAALREATTTTHLTRPNASRAWDVRAPVAGKILRIMQESESPIGIGQPIVEIGNPADLEVVIDALTTDAVDIHPGAAVWFEHWGGQERVTGRVRTIEPAAFTKLSALGVEEQRVNIIIDIVSPTGEWQKVGDGYKVDAHIVVSEAMNVLKAPSSALFRDQNDGANSWFAYKVEGDRARKTKVEIGVRSAESAIVLGGLIEHDRVVVYPGESLHDGVRVRIGLR